MSERPEGLPAGSPADPTPVSPHSRSDGTDDLERLLATGGGLRRGRWLGWLIAVVAAVAAGVFLLGPDESRGVRYLTEPARRYDLVVHVTATGALQPTNQVEVGTEVSGTIESVAVRFNDHVEAGQVLARLDTDRLEATVAQSTAALASARARLAEARATAEEARLRLARLERLTERQMVSEEELTAQRAAASRAEAGIAAAEAAITEAQARLSSDTTNLDKAIIRAPIDGIVLSRQVEPGQTVAASLQTPVLFTLAETLARMELDVAVDEADVGQVEPGQQATFTVAAYPDRAFPAVIEAIHFAPTTSTEGVVTYEAVLSVDNDELLLRPGMTATADIVVEARRDVLVVPNAALRFEPPGSAPDRPGMPIFPGPRVRVARPGGAARVPTVWVLEDGQPARRQVSVGASDGVVSEIASGDLEAGDPVVVDYELTGGSR